MTQKNLGETSYDEWGVCYYGFIHNGYLHQWKGWENAKQACASLGLDYLQLRRVVTIEQTKRTGNVSNANRKTLGL